MSDPGRADAGNCRMGLSRVIQRILWTGVLLIVPYSASGKCSVNSISSQITVDCKSVYSLSSKGSSRIIIIHWYENSYRKSGEGVEK